MAIKHRSTGILIFILALSIFITGCPDRKQGGNIVEPNILTDIEQKVFEQINDYRISQGMNALNLHEQIVYQARNHSRDMARGTVSFGHEGFNQRVSATGIAPQSAAENVAYNQGYSDPATRAVQGWLDSPGHLKNIRGNFNYTGIGIERNNAGTYYFTQIFMLTEGGTAQITNQQSQQQQQPENQNMGRDWSWLKFWE